MSEYPTQQAVMISPPRQQVPVASAGALTVLDIKRQVNQLHEVMTEVMQEGLHYGHIPGTPEGQLALYKEGAEKLGLTFRLAARFPKDRQEMRELAEGHREYTSFCEVRHIPTGEVWGEIERSCTTLESKYRWRTAARVCPDCGAEAIIRGNKSYGGGWLCWKKREGCGAKFMDGDQTIEGQEAGRVENPDIADNYNGCLGMSQKRAHVAAMKMALACSDIFKQSAYEIDEDLTYAEVIEEEPAKDQATEKREQPVKTKTVTKKEANTPEYLETLMATLAENKITEGAFRLYIYKTFKLNDPAALTPAHVEEVYEWIHKTTTG